MSELDRLPAVSDALGLMVEQVQRRRRGGDKPADERARLVACAYVQQLINELGRLRRCQIAIMAPGSTVGNWK